MYFLIDYENVFNPGMRGTEYLLPDDHVIVFYSELTSNMETRYLTDIKNSGCSFEVCKLYKVRKNALDFYIATRLGEIFGSGYQGNIVIVSKDEGFQSLKEYWAYRSVPPRRVLLAESVERGIISANEPNKRTTQLHTQIKGASIGGFYAAYQESRRLRSQLDEEFSGTEFASLSSEFEELLKSGKAPRDIYLEVLRRFGRVKGLMVYRILKPHIEPGPKK